MKKSIFIFLFFVFLSFNMLIIPSLAQPKVLKEGIYKISDLNLAPDVKYNIQNTSSDKDVLVIVFDSNQVAQQYLQLEPKSEEKALVRFQEGYKLLVIGEGEVTIS